MPEDKSPRNSKSIHMAVDNTLSSLGSGDERDVLCRALAKNIHTHPLMGDGEFEPSLTPEQITDLQKDWTDEEKLGHLQHQVSLLLSILTSLHPEFFGRGAVQQYITSGFLSELYHLSRWGDAYFAKMAAGDHHYHIRAEEFFHRPSSAHHMGRSVDYRAKALERKKGS